MNENDWQHYKPFCINANLFALGQIWKVKPVNNENQCLLARVINLSNVQPDVVDRILQEAAELKKRNCKWFLPIEGIYFNEEEKRITFYMP